LVAWKPNNTAPQAQVVIASLPMYDRPELAAHHQAFWALIRDRLRAAGISAPDRLDQSVEGLDVWLSPELVFSQACGMPYRKMLHGRVTLIGTPDYGLPDCDPGYYNSVIIAKPERVENGLSGADGATLAINSPMSQSGCAAAHVAARKAGVRFGSIVQTGAHLNSIDAVRSGKADIAAIDAITWRYFCRYDGLQGLSVVGHTEQTPGLPFITSIKQDGALFFDAVAEAIKALTPRTGQALGLRGIVSIPASDYLSVKDD
jgi:ABC-type phosphate/phosphonate transport system substrate-binding protein